MQTRLTLFYTRCSVIKHVHGVDIVNTYQLRTLVLRRHSSQRIVGRGAGRSEG